ncbi:MAG TPA: restriction endonuclease [Rhizomicrobium sp.]
MTDVRLPSFNDFSPHLLKNDIRKVLQPIADHQGDDKAIIEIWANEFFGGKKNKRSSTNIPATLKSTGLTTGDRPMELSEIGQTVCTATDAQDAARKFCGHILLEKNGTLLIEAINGLRSRGIDVSKKSLKDELKTHGVGHLSTNTTDHTTLKNWFVAAGLIDDTGAPNNDEIKSITGISPIEADELKGLSLAQQVFLHQLRRMHVTDDGPFQGAELLKACMSLHPQLFDEGQFAKQVRIPLEDAGWIKVEGLGKGKQGGKSGSIVGLQKLLDIPVKQVMPDFDQVIPAELRAKLNLPLAEIEKDLWGTDKHLAGLALELLALRMMIEMGLNPREFRARSADTAHAEVDLIGDRADLLFSRWTFQCKRYGKDSDTKVGLGDAAKEVGIALFCRAHVVVMATTTSFTKDAVNYAREIETLTPLQFVFIDGKVVKDFLQKGRTGLLDFIQANAQKVMQTKRNQPLRTSLPE